MLPTSGTQTANDYKTKQFETVYSRRIRAKIKRLQQNTINSWPNKGGQKPTPLTPELILKSLDIPPEFPTTKADDINIMANSTGNAQQKNVTSQPSNSGLQTKNRFGILQNESDDDEEPAEIPMETITTNRSDEGQGPSQEQKEIKPPPIIITSKIQDYKTFHKGINDTLNGSKYQINYQRNNTIFKTSNINDFNKLKASLAQGNVECYTYTLKTDKLHKIVLKAAPHMESDEIKTFFESKNIKVSNCTKLKSNKQGIQSSSFLISTTNKEELKQLTTTKEMEHIKLRWEDFVKKNPVTQCWRCQDVGHGSGNCLRRPRCLKCAANHSTKDCHIKERSEANKMKLRCCNCGGNHPANYRNCPYIMDYINKHVSAKRLANTNTGNKNIKTNDTNFHINPEKFPSIGKYTRQNSLPYKPITQTYSYAQATKSQNNVNILNELSALTNTNNILNLISLLKDLKHAAETLQTINDPLEKLELLMQLINKHNI